MARFLAIVLSVWAIMHLYVFWRLSTVPWVAAHIPRPALLLAAVALCTSYPLARILGAKGLQAVACPLEFLAATWIGVLFLLFSALLVTDAVTLGGWFLPRLSPVLRGLAVGLALLLSVIGLWQGRRPPVLRGYEVQLAGLPPERDGLVLVALSDLHLGTLIGERWLKRLVHRVEALRPDLLLVVGDLVDGNVGNVESLLPYLKNLRAPLGTWAVTGNHEYYAGLDRGIALFEAAGFSVLRDRWSQIAPGLVLVGVDDLTARQQYGQNDKPVEEGIGRPPSRGYHSAVAFSFAGGQSCRRWRRSNVVRSHPQWSDLAFQPSGCAQIPAHGRALPSRGNDRRCVSRCRHLGTTHASLVAQ